MDFFLLQLYAATGAGLSALFWVMDHVHMEVECLHVVGANLNVLPSLHGEGGGGGGSAPWTPATTLEWRSAPQLMHGTYECKSIASSY